MIVAAFLAVLLFMNFYIWRGMENEHRTIERQLEELDHLQILERAAHAFSNYKYHLIERALSLSAQAETNIHLSRDALTLELNQMAKFSPQRAEEIKKLLNKIDASSYEIMDAYLDESYESGRKKLSLLQQDVKYVEVIFSTVITPYRQHVAQAGVAIMEQDAIARRNLIGASLVMFFLVFLIFLVMQRQILRPLHRMIQAMSRISNGEMTTAIPALGRHNEIGEMARALEIFRDNLRHIQDAEKTFRAVVNTALDVILTIDDKGIVHSCNPAVESVFGYRPEEVVGKNVSLLAPPSHAKKHDSYLKNYLKTGKAKIIGKGYRELEAVHKSGEIIPIELAVVEIEVGGNKTFFGNIRDIRVRKEAEEQIKQHTLELEEKVTERTEELQKALEDAQAANYAKKDFLANMSHEIRTPLNGVVGMIEMLQRTTLSAEQEDYVVTAAKSSESLLWLINDVLDFAKIESGQLTLEPISFNLESTINDVADTFVHSAEKKGLSLHVRHEPGIPVYVIGDPGRLRQMLINLIGNAIKFTSEGYIYVDVKCTKSLKNKAVFHVSVRDTGIGIAKELQQHIFDRFSQADESTTRKFGGTGLGLSITRELARLMDGNIGVESEPGEGAMFWFTVNLQVDDKAVQPEKAIDVGVLKDVRVAIVDDNEINRIIFKELLGTVGMQGDILPSGKDLLAFLRKKHTKKSKPELILLDSRLGDCDTTKLASDIQKIKEMASIPLVLHTSLGQRGDAHKYASFGFSGYILKPLRPQEFFGILSMIYMNKTKKKGHFVTRHSFRELLEAAINPQKSKSKAKNKQPRVLLVEDDRINQKIMMAFGERIGVDITLAQNGQEAVDILDENTFDLVFMDMQMPVMGGVEATKKIRSREKKEKRTAVPIVALTANAMKEDKEACMEAGMDDYLSKPVTLDKIEQCCHRWVKG